MNQRSAPLGRIDLFHPGHVAPESTTFQIPFGGQMTVAAIGLEAGDFIEFQLVFIPTVDPDTCACPPGQVILPHVAAYATVKCCGEPVRLTSDNPIVILDNPQRFFIRAVLTAADIDEVYAWAIETKTGSNNDRLRGCSCEGDQP